MVSCGAALPTPCPPPDVGSLPPFFSRHLPPAFVVSSPALSLHPPVPVQVLPDSHLNLGTASSPAPSKLSSPLSGVAVPWDLVTCAAAGPGMGLRIGSGWIDCTGHRLSGSRPRLCVAFWALQPCCQGSHWLQGWPSSSSGPAVPHHAVQSLGLNPCRQLHLGPGCPSSPQPCRQVHLSRGVEGSGPGHVCSWRKHHPHTAWFCTPGHICCWKYLLCSEVSV